MRAFKDYVYSFGVTKVIFSLALDDRPTGRHCSILPRELSELEQVIDLALPLGLIWPDNRGPGVFLIKSYGRFSPSQEWRDSVLIGAVIPIHSAVFPRRTQSAPILEKFFTDSG